MRENHQPFDFGPAGRPKYLHVKQAKGRFYYYFDTGCRGRDGQRLLAPLPRPGEAWFTSELAKAQKARFKNETRIIHVLQRGERPADDFDPATPGLGRALVGSDDLYFIRCADAVKIGRAADVWRRMANMQVNCPLEMDCICRLPGRGHEEHQWHAFFRDDWIRGEWFDWIPTIAAALDLAKAEKPWWQTPLQCRELDRE